MRVAGVEEMRLTMQSRCVSAGTATAPLGAEATSTETSAALKTFLAAMQCWLDHAREHEVIALAALVNTECDRRSREVHAMDCQGCGPGRVSTALSLPQQMAVAGGRKG